MNEPSEEMPLFERTGNSMLKDRRRNLPASEVPKAKRLADPPASGRLQRYASAFWLPDYDLETGSLRLTIGWAMQLEGSRDHESGGWTLRSSMPPKPVRLKNILSLVEETHGVVFRRPTEYEEEINTHADRLISDWLLFLMHRMLFNQCRKLDSRIPEGAVDVFLLYGPALPKFVGRVCYSNFNRNKTVAVLAPTVRVGEHPEQSRWAWNDEPSPSFGHDRAVRRWKTKIGNGDTKSPLKLGSFTLVEPTGDGFSGKIVGRAMLGPTKWLQKSCCVRDIIEQDSVDVKLAIWRHRELRVPRGLAFASRAAVLQNDWDDYTKRTDRLTVEFNQESRSLFNRYDQRIRNEIAGVRGSELAKKALVARARWTYADKVLSQEVGGRAKYNRPEAVPLHTVRAEMETTLGESVFGDFAG
jgi:hypothetical protein